MRVLIDVGAIRMFHALLNETVIVVVEENVGDETRVIVEHRTVTIQGLRAVDGNSIDLVPVMEQRVD